MNKTKNTFRVWALAASFLLHGLVALVLVVWQVQPHAPQPKVQTVAVEIISATEFDAAPAAASSVPAQQVSTEPAQITSAKPAATPSNSSQVVQATKMLGQAAFADPRNAGARKMLGQLSDDTRREQLCDIEAVEQIHAWKTEWAPERVVSYARDDAVLKGNSLVAKGAAVQVGAQWFALEFACSLNRNISAVTGFAFKVGAVILEKDWDRFNLGMAGDDED